MTPEAKEARARVERLGRELDAAKGRLAHIERKCPHQWSAVQYTPDVREAYRTQNIQGHFTVDRNGHIDAPIVDVPRQETPKWSQTCGLCGRVDTTTHTNDRVTKVPNFGSRR